MKQSDDIKPTKVSMLKSQDTPSKSSRLERFLPWVLIVCGLIGTIASVAITAEKFHLLQHPGSQFICDLNPIINCGSVMQSNQANAFGFMNTYIGLLGFPVVFFIGMAMLAGATFRRWFWLGLEFGLGLGVLFAYWLLLESIYSIHALCPYCLGIDIAITTAFWYLTLYLLGKGFLHVPANLRRLGNFGRRHHLDILIVWFLTVTAVIFQHFWYYFGPHLFHIG